MKVRDYIKEHNIKSKYEIYVYSEALKYSHQKRIINNKLYYLDFVERNYAIDYTKELDNEIVESNIETREAIDPISLIKTEYKVHYLRVRRLAYKNKGTSKLIDKKLVEAKGNVRVEL